MFKQIKTHDLFPTPVWSLDLEEETATRLNRQIMVQLDRLLTPRPEIPLGATWQTDQRLHTLPAFAELTACIEKAARGALDFMKVDYSRFEITACWANINPQGSLNSSHSHPNNYLSGVYYVRVPEGSGTIVFEDPRRRSREPSCPRSRATTPTTATRRPSRSPRAASCSSRPICATACRSTAARASGSPSPTTSCSAASRRRWPAPSGAACPSATAPRRRQEA